MDVSPVGRGTHRKAKPLDTKKTGVRILLGIVVGVIAVSMLLYLVPGMGSANITNADVVAEVDGQPVSVDEVLEQRARLESNGQMPPQMARFYTAQIVDNLVLERMMEAEAKRLGITVSESEVADRIQAMVPGVVVNGKVDMTAYSSQIAALGNGMTVEQFEDQIRKSLLSEKIQDLVTSSVSVSPEEVRAEFLRKNEKIKLDYALIHPDSLESQVQVADSDLTAYYEKNKVKYQVPEQRVVRYLLIDPGQLQSQVHLPDSEIQAYYNAHISEYKVEDRVQISVIQFKTMGKTDAEIAEIRKKAEEALKEAKKPNAKFEDVVKKYSEDAATKDKGGDMGWVGRGQALPEMERAAFSLPKGGISDVVQTQLGLYIIKVTDKETAHIKTLAEVLPSILEVLTTQQAQAVANDDSKKISDLLRRNAHPVLDDIAKQFGLATGETKPISVNDATPELGASPELHDAIFRMRVGDVSQPIVTDRGFVVISIQAITPAHQGAFEEVRAKVTGDFRHDKAVELAKQRAADLAKRGQGGEDFSKAAKALNIEVKTSDLIGRDGSIPGAGTATQFVVAFGVPVGKVGDPVYLGTDWLVFRVSEHQQANPADFEKQKQEVEDSLLNSKRQLAFESFREALENQLRAERKLTYNRDALNKLAGSP